MSRLENFKSKDRPITRTTRTHTPELPSRDFLTPIGRYKTSQLNKAFTPIRNTTTIRHKLFKRPKTEAVKNKLQQSFYETQSRSSLSVLTQFPIAAGRYIRPSKENNLTYEKVWNALFSGSLTIKPQNKIRLSSYLRTNRWLTYKLPKTHC